MRWARLLLVILFAALTFGGSFECHGSSGSHRRHNDDDDDDARRVQLYAMNYAFTAAIA